MPAPRPDERRHVAITRLPGPELAACELTWRAREPIDVERAAEEHGAFRAVLARLGCDVVALPPLAGHPDATFVEDVAVVLDELAVLPVLGAASRRGESASIATALSAWRTVVALEEGHLDGGDVLAVEDVLYVGQSRRTNHAALKALAHLVLSHGLRVKAAPVRGALHLKTACTRVGTETLLVNREWVDLGRVRDLEILEVPRTEPFGANVLSVGGTLVVPSAHPRTADLLASHGARIETVELTELSKAEAGPTCLALLLEGAASGPA
jgi:dimethylargininase